MLKSGVVVSFLLVFSMMTLPSFAEEGCGVIDLSGTWRLKDYSRGVGAEKKIFMAEFDKSSFLPIKIPGTVRQALLEAGEVADPYYGYDNEKSMWIEEKEWWFCTNFRVNSGQQGKYIDLVFEGTVFKGDVWLNGKYVGELEGMFNPRSFDVSKALHFEGENSLAVRLEAPEDARKIQRTGGLTFRLPRGERKQLYSIAQCLFSWDWAPHTVPIGIWKPVKLRYSGEVRVENPYILSSVKSEKLAILDISCEVRNLTNSTKKLILKGKIEGKGFEAGSAGFSREINLAPQEKRTAKFNVDVQDPKLWWPNGMGDQNLYLLHTEVTVKGELSDKCSTQFGIRELKIVENELVGEFIKGMKEHTGSVYHLGKVIGSYPWTFQINGKKMFAKGGNWIPIDHLLRLDRERYDLLLKLVKAANMNLLRVWGGGLYETDDFYELCDEYGILAWQEFLSNKDFSQIDRENFLEGARATILRLRNYPSLTFWCGGNEFDPDDFGSKAVIDELEELLKKLDPAREFHRASPYMGDDHYWGVWHGRQPYTRYRVVRPFRSEAGINTFPVLENYKKFTPDDKLWPPDKIHIEYHGEQNTRFRHLIKLIRYADEFGLSSSIEEFITKSQLYQAIGNQFNMEFCRANKFKNSGLLFWQYNDSWPCLSWSLVDWYGTPKPSYFFVKRASKPVHISADYEKYLWDSGETFNAAIYLLNDSYKPLKELKFQALLLDINSKTLAKKSGTASVEINRSKKIGDIQWMIPEAYKGKTFFIAVKLTDKNNQPISDAIYPIAVSRHTMKKSKLTSAQETKKLQPVGNKEYFEIFSELNDLPEVSLRSKVSVNSIKLDKNGLGKTRLMLTNPSKKLAFFIRVRLDTEPDDFTAFYSDNYVTLLPQEKKQIEINVLNRGNASGEVSMKLKVSGWNCPLTEFPITIVREQED